MHNKQVDRTIRKIFGKIIPKLYQSPDIWAEENINFELDITARQNNFDLSLTPYLRDPLNAWEFAGKIKEVVVVAPEQTGKTLSWVIGLLWSMEFMPCLSLVCYKSDDKAVEINEQKIKPLMRKIPNLAEELSVPLATRKDRYNFSNLKSYFMGAGSRITSVSSKIRIADELDDWIDHEDEVTNLQDLRKRARSFDESLFYKVCTVKGTKKTSNTWQEFLLSSKGYWTLQCQGCKKLTMRSCDVHNLQWELTEDGNVIENRLRLICPVCGYEHIESEKAKMNIRGKYIHQNESLIESNPGFQWGALASQFKVLNWLSIANAQIKAGKSGYIEDQKYFDNSIRGLPFRRRTALDSNIDKIKKHAIKEFDFKKMFMSVDTQDDGFFYVIRGLDNKMNSCYYTCGKVRNVEELQKVYDGIYAGLKLFMAIIDTGGHRLRDVIQFIRKNRGVYGYKGNNRIMTRWQQGKKEKKVIIAKASQLQSELLYYIYSADKKDNNYWYISENVKDGYFEQMADLRPDNKRKNGDEYENWTSSGNDHYFDCEKMFLILKDLYIQYVVKQRKNRKKIRKPIDNET